MKLGLVRRTTKLGSNEGANVFTQQRGVPIGWLWSAAAASTILGGAEEVRAQDSSLHLAHRFDTNGGEWRRTMGCTRYVDDRLAVSRVLCRDSCCFDVPGLDAALMRPRRLPMGKSSGLMWKSLQLSRASLSSGRRSLSVSGARGRPLVPISRIYRRRLALLLIFVTCGHWPRGGCHALARVGCKMMIS